MNKLVLLLANSVRTHGLLRTLHRCIRYPVGFALSYRKRRDIFASDSIQDRFSKIYELNWWGSPESRSGTGSTVAYTQNLRQELPGIVSRFSICSIYDAPCGDFNWMRHVLPALDVDYHGADIVPALIEENSRLFSTARSRFTIANIICDPVPDVDLWICRDCLFHFSYHDIFLALSNFAKSNARYLLTTTHINSAGFQNVDIETGDARAIDLFSPPFGLPRSTLLAIDDWAAPELPRQMVLFSRQQIAEALPKMAAAIGTTISLQ